MTGEVAVILERINGPSDVKRLSWEDTERLCGEIRRFLIENVSRTGGHLASNLGVVELTVAIHRVFDTANDRLVFDVGHQCYVHKMLTGRRDRFPTLRQLDGLSGFPKPYESVHDAFIAGHASNSVSVALGMARARTLSGGSYDVLALIGDGAMTGGLSFEGLNDAGASGEPMIVILNDNGMSIEANVGAMSRHLARLRSQEGYNSLKKWYRTVMQGSQTKQKVYEASHDVKQWLKSSLMPESTMFEKMGFSYMGPVDGHDVKKLAQMLTWAREKHGPVLLHVLTEKGRGYTYAQQEPERFHGTPPFDTESGKPLKASGKSFSGVFGETLTELAGQDNRICAVTAAMTSGTGLTPFANAYPQRFFDVGIAEGHAVSMCAGMAKQGLIPVFAVYSSFLQRGFDMLVHDVSLSGLHVVLGVDRAGLVGADGETHHGCFDPMYLSQIPGMEVFCPSSFQELREMLRRAVLECTGPVAVRYPRGGEGAYQGCCGAEDATVLREGQDFTIVTYGILVNQAIAAAEELEKNGIHTGIVKLNRITPLSTETVAGIMKRAPHVLVLEDCLATCCVGQRLAAVAAQVGACPERLLLKNSGCTLAPEGSVDELYHRLGLDAISVAAAIKETMHEQ